MTLAGPDARGAAPAASSRTSRRAFSASMRFRKRLRPGARETFGGAVLPAGNNRLVVRVHVDEAFETGHDYISVMVSPADSFSDLMDTLQAAVNRCLHGREITIADILLMYSAPGVEGALCPSDHPHELLKQWIGVDCFKLSLQQAKSAHDRVRIYIGSWNVDSGQPDVPGVDRWLVNHSTAATSPDICVYGLQEVSMSRDAVLFNDTSSGRKWIVHFLSVLSRAESTSPYVLLECKQLGGILIIVLVKRDHLPFISDVRTDSVGTGVLGMGNKGGVGIRFLFHGTSMCFVNSHLAAHQQNVQRRNEDYAEISKKMQFASDGAALRLQQDHQLLVWMGDLNYRIDSDYHDTIAHVIDRDWTYLQQRDQLRANKLAGLCFKKFNEGPLNFPPTYKFDPGTDNYDTSPLRRIPAYCDRILWSAAVPVQQLYYNCHVAVRASDHKPIYSLLSAKVRMEPLVAAQRQQQPQQQPQQQQGKRASLALPSLHRSFSTLVFDGESADPAAEPAPTSAASPVVVVMAPDAPTPPPPPPPLVLQPAASFFRSMGTISLTSCDSSSPSGLVSPVSARRSPAQSIVELTDFPEHGKALEEALSQIPDCSSDEDSADGDDMPDFEPDDDGAPSPTGSEPAEDLSARRFHSRSASEGAMHFTPPAADKTLSTRSMAPQVAPPKPVQQHSEAVRQQMREKYGLDAPPSTPPPRPPSERSSTRRSTISVAVSPRSRVGSRQAKDE